MKILADASLPGLDAAFPSPFELSVYHDAEELVHLLDEQEVLLCRANLKINSFLLKKENNLRYVATASSGTDHIERDYLNTLNIKVLDAKGCNASAVADYILANIAYLQQNHLLPGKQAGIVGMGKVGTEVLLRLQAAGFSVHTFDPLRASLGSTFLSCSLENLYQCDLICVHAELHSNPPYPSLNLINEDFLSQLKPGVVLLNASRGGIVNEDALLNHSTPLVYCTDVYSHEPHLNAELIAKATLCTPHIAGHSLEAKHKAVELISRQLHAIKQWPIPSYTPTHTPTRQILRQPWQEQILSIYNPALDTQELKQAADKPQAFAQQRKNHHFRHDFQLYFAPPTEQSMKQLLGFQTDK